MLLGFDLNAQASSDHLSPSLSTQEKPFQRPAGPQCLIQCFVALYPKAIINSLGQTRRNPGQEFRVSPVKLNGHEHGFLTEDIFLLATLSLFMPLHHCWGLLWTLDCVCLQGEKQQLLCKSRI